jgi:hypothetical protein
MERDRPQEMGGGMAPVARRQPTGATPMSDTASLAHLEAAMAITRKIGAKVDKLLAPLALEMEIMEWKPEYRAIVWEAVMIEARQRMEKAEP